MSARCHGDQNGLPFDQTLILSYFVVYCPAVCYFLEELSFLLELFSVAAPLCNLVLGRMNFWYFRKWAEIPGTFCLCATPLSAKFSVYRTCTVMLCFL